MRHGDLITSGPLTSVQERRERISGGPVEAKTNDQLFYEDRRQTSVFLARQSMNLALSLSHRCSSLEEGGRSCQSAVRNPRCVLTSAFLRPALAAGARR